MKASAAPTPFKRRLNPPAARGVTSVLGTTGSAMALRSFARAGLLALRTGPLTAPAPMLSPLLHLHASSAGFTTSASAAERNPLAGARNLVENEIYDRSRREITLGNRMPCVACDAFIADNAVVIGDVNIADRSCVWHGAVGPGRQTLPQNVRGWR